MIWWFGSDWWVQSRKIYSNEPQRTKMGHKPSKFPFQKIPLRVQIKLSRIKSFFADKNSLKNEISIFCYFLAIRRKHKNNDSELQIFSRWSSKTWLSQKSEQKQRKQEFLQFNCFSASNKTFFCIFNFWTNFLLNGKINGYFWE